MSWVRTERGWRHAPWWKRAINTVLRTLQPRSGRPVLVYTIADVNAPASEPPRVIAYGIGRIDVGHWMLDGGGE